MVYQRGYLRAFLSGVLALPFLAWAESAVSGDRSERLTESMIGAVIDEALSRDQISPHALTALAEAEILRIDLLRQEALSAAQWVAVIELEADYGPAPPAVIGFERVRQGQYRLVLVRQDGRLILQRFTPMAGRELLPAGH